MYVRPRDQGPGPAEDDQNKNSIMRMIPTIPAVSRIEPTMWTSTPEPFADTA
jgi:hypothetical protein